MSEKKNAPESHTFNKPQNSNPCCTRHWEDLSETLHDSLPRQLCFFTCMQYDHGCLCGSQQRTHKPKASDKGILRFARLNERRSYWRTAIQTRMRFITTHTQPLAVKRESIPIADAVLDPSATSTSCTTHGHPMPVQSQVVIVVNYRDRTMGIYYLNYAWLVQPWRLRPTLKDNMCDTGST